MPRGIPVSPPPRVPLGTGPPVLQRVLLGPLDPPAVSETALRLCGRDDGDLTQVDLQVLVHLTGDDGLGAPGAAAVLRADAAAMRTNVLLVV